MRRLYRSRTDRWIAGVCGGLAAYLDVDVSAVRLAFVLLAFWNGLGVILYLVLLVLLPDEPVPEVVTGVPPPAEDEPQRRARILGALLVVVGAYLLAQQTPVFTVLFRQPWAGAVLVVGGLLVLLFWPRR
jgi:phage shock protein C